MNSELKLIKAGFFSAVFFALSGCHSPVEVACSELPRIESEALLLKKELMVKTSPSRPVGRRVASAPLASTETELQSSEPWLGWAENRLRESEHLRDALSDEHRTQTVLKQLNESSLQLVTFHGYIAQSRYRPAQKSLEQFQDSVTQLRKELCTAGK